MDKQEYSMVIEGTLRHQNNIKINAHYFSEEVRKIIINKYDKEYLYNEKSLGKNNFLHLTTFFMSTL